MTPGFKYAEYNNLKAFEDAITDKTIAIMIDLYKVRAVFTQLLRNL